MNPKPSDGSPLVSVIIPCYNYGRYVSEAIDSALAQTYRPIEIIVVDDGSTDDTETVVRRYGEPVRYVRRANGGQPAARNTGLAVSKGEYIQFLDADDLLLPEKVAAQVAVMQAKPVIAVSYTNYRKINLHSGKDTLFHPRGQLTGNPLEDLLFNWETDLSFPPHCTLIRRSVWSGEKPFREGVRSHEDWEMWIDLALKGARFEYLDIMGVVYRWHPGSSSAAKELRVFTSTLSVAQAVLAKIPAEYRVRFEEHAWEMCDGQLRRAVFPSVPNHAQLYRDAASELATLKSSNTWWLSRCFSLVARPVRAATNSAGKRSGAPGSFSAPGKSPLPPPLSTGPLVSVIIPCYNYGRFLPEAIASVLGQTYQPIEIIVVDDGSTDDTEAVARRYGDRIKYLRRQNAGQAAARNAGFAATTGEYIQFLDADDVLMPEKLATQVAFLETSPRIDVCYSNYRKINNQTGNEALYQSRVQLRGSALEDFLFAWESELSFPPHCALIRRSVWNGRKPCCEQLRAHEDWEMWVDLALRGARFEYLDFVGVIYRLHPQSANSNNALMLTNTVHVAQIILPRVSSEYRERFEEHAWRLCDNRVRQSMLPDAPDYAALSRETTTELNAIKTSSSWRLAQLFSRTIQPIRAVFRPKGRLQP